MIANKISTMLGLLVIFACTLSSVDAGTRAVLAVVDFSPYAYACEISDFGNSVEGDAVHRATLMRPPEDPQLCTLPSIVSSADSNTTLPVPFRIPIGLMVSLGGCGIHTKISVALELLIQASPHLKYLVFYNNDADNNDEIVPINSPDSNSGFTFPEDIERLSILSVSTGAGVNLMGLIQKYSEATNTSSQLLVEGNEDWDLEMVVKRVPHLNNATVPPNPYGSSAPGMNGPNFKWFRVVLFGLLIMSPCCRGAYLWWNGGGRIHFRRNENGRIVGLHYVPPVSYWFASNGVQDTRTPIRNRLTEEQVMALPEIVFKPSADANSDAQEECNGGVGLAPNLEDVDIIITSGSAEDEIAARHPQSPQERAPFVSESVRGSDEEQILEGSYETNFTTCSICIDEFEAGERLRLLPRCKHVFHTECILPWLTERQGCCPLCKTSVIDQGEARNEGLDRDVDQRQNVDGPRLDFARSIAPAAVSADAVPESSTARLPEHVPVEEDPETTDTLEEHPVRLSTPDQDGTVTSQPELPNVMIEQGQNEGGCFVDTPISTDDPPHEIIPAVTSIPDTATDADHLTLSGRETLS